MVEASAEPWVQESMLQCLLFDLAFIREHAYHCVYIVSMCVITGPRRLERRKYVEMPKFECSRPFSECLCLSLKIQYSPRL